MARVAPQINEVAPPVRGEKVRIKTSKIKTIDTVREIHQPTGGWIVRLMDIEGEIIVIPAHPSSRSYGWREVTESA